MAKVTTEDDLGLGIGPNALRRPGAQRRATRPAFLLAVACALVFLPQTGIAGGRGQEGRAGANKHCTATAEALSSACQKQAQADYAIARAICINVSDDAARAQCLADAKASRREAEQFCRTQLEGRIDACALLGEGRYDPPIDPAAFDADFTNITNPNRYFPLGFGYRWEYSGEGEVNILEIPNETKMIEGVVCIVVRDRVFKDGDLVENTDDWFAQAKNGDVYYFGEEVKDFESHGGDNPRQPELVSISGSFKWGRDGDKGGIFFSATPRQGDAYLEEFSLANAEDVTEILSTTYSFGSNAELDQLVPRLLAELLCSGDCIVTKNYSLLEPGIFARKYYAPGIGVFLEVKPEVQKTVQLVNCNFDPRCTGLPGPRRAVRP